MRLSDDELWEKAGTDQPITMEDIGLLPKESNIGVIHLHYSGDDKMIIAIILFMLNTLCLICEPSMYQIGTINAIACGILLSNILWQIKIKE